MACGVIKKKPVVLETEYGELRIHYIDEGKENDKTGQRDY